MKKCKTCGVEKELNQFYKHKSCKGGYMVKCKECMRKYRRNHYKENYAKPRNFLTEEEKQDRRKKQRKEYYKKNKKKLQSNQKERYKNNKEYYRDSYKKWYEKNREKRIEYYKKWKEENPNWQKDYNEENKDKLNEYYKEYYKNKYHTDPLYRLKNSIISNLRSALNRKFNKSKKAKRTEEILGCKISFFKKYIERQFKDGMSWENQGDWHLDHIRPLSLAKTEEELYELNHYTNFQPLWGRDNIVKGNKIVEKQLRLL